MKLSDIGLRGVFAGWGLSFVKDSLGYGAFFATFEYVKAQSFYGFITRYYGGWRPGGRDPAPRLPIENALWDSQIRPHYAIEPTFLLLAGVAASLTQQIIQHPIGLIQSIHYQALPVLDRHLRRKESRSFIFGHYLSSYKRTYQRCLGYVESYGGWRKWLFRGFLWSSIKQVPSTSAGLIIFELVRRRYGSQDEATRIQIDGYDILLT